MFHIFGILSKRAKENANKECGLGLCLFEVQGAKKLGEREKCK